MTDNAAATNATSDFSRRLDGLGEQLQQGLGAKYEAREQAIPLCREAIRHSANGIRAVHRRDFERAVELIRRAGEAVHGAAEALHDHRDIYWAGFVHDAQKEFAEACLTLAVVAREPIPAPSDLGVEPAAYLNGLAEAGGELRRHLLDLLREGDIAGAEAVLNQMDDIYSLLVTIDFPDAMTGGLRRNTDMVRGVLEKSRGDLTAAVRQRALEERLDRLQAHGVAPFESVSD